MLYVPRPVQRRDFWNESQHLLNQVRQRVEARGGVPNGEDFKGRELWSGSWKRDGRHKWALAGSPINRAKCAYCERILEVARELDVEHYRPKACVTEWKSDPPLVGDVPPAEVAVGTGYWWLAFDWANYTLACKPCNQAWKRNLFPVRERFTCVEGVEASEQPLLIDPASPFSTREHFAWTVDAIMVGVSEQGRATIATCGLNRRNLCAQRLKVSQDVRRVLEGFCAACRRHAEGESRRHYARLGELGGRDSEFTGMVRWIVEQALHVEWEQLEGMPT